MDNVSPRSMKMKPEYPRYVLWHFAMVMSFDPAVLAVATWKWSYSIEFLPNPEQSWAVKKAHLNMHHCELPKMTETTYGKYLLA